MFKFRFFYVFQNSNLTDRDFTDSHKLGPLSINIGSSFAPTFLEAVWIRITRINLGYFRIQTFTRLFIHLRGSSKNNIPFTLLTNSAFQSGDARKTPHSALATHFKRWMAKAESIFNSTPPLWKAELVIRRKWVDYFLNSP